MVHAVMSLAVACQPNKTASDQGKVFREAQALCTATGYAALGPANGQRQAITCISPQLQPCDYGSVERHVVCVAPPCVTAAAVLEGSSPSAGSTSAPRRATLLRRGSLPLYHAEHSSLPCAAPRPQQPAKLDGGPHAPQDARCHSLGCLLLAVPALPCAPQAGRRKQPAAAAATIPGGVC